MIKPKNIQRLEDYLREPVGGFRGAPPRWFLAWLVSLPIIMIGLNDSLNHLEIYKINKELQRYENYDDRSIVGENSTAGYLQDLIRQREFYENDKILFFR